MWALYYLELKSKERVSLQFNLSKENVKSIWIRLNSKGT